MAKTCVSISNKFLTLCNNITTVAQSNLSLAQISRFEIPLPSLEIQKQIVEKSDVERSAIEQAKKLKNIFEQKIKDILAKLWRE